jgi:MFS family permease
MPSASLLDDCGTEAKLNKQLPKLQILLVCYARIMEPVAFYSIFPYIAEMVQREGKLSVSHVGFYSGLIESIFSATQIIVLFFLGPRIDRLGRKKILVISLGGMAVGSMLFGLATSLWQMILFRSLTGVFSGVNFILRTMVGDHCDAETLAQAFSWYSNAGSLGCFFGPILGAALVDPAVQYPSVFGGSFFFGKYPFALPGLVVGTFISTAAVSSALFVEETLKPGSAQIDSEEVPERLHVSPQLSMLQLLKAPDVLAVFRIYGYVSVLSIALLTLPPVALYTPVNVGGMGCSPAVITLYLTVMAVSQIFWLLFVFHFIHRRVRTQGVLRISCIMFPFCFAAYPLMNVLLRGGSKVGRNSAIVVGIINSVIGVGASMASTATQMAVNEVSPCPEVLGKLSSMAEICSSIVRATIPGISTAIFAIGVKGNILSGQLAWWILFIFSIGLGIAAKG